MISRFGLMMRRKRGLRMCRAYGLEPTPHRVGANGETPVMCSCFMCGNPRRHFRGRERLTMAERRAALSEMEERAEIFGGAGEGQSGISDSEPC